MNMNSSTMNSNLISKLTGEPLKKRGRKSKKELLEKINNTIENKENSIENSIETNIENNIIISMENMSIEDINMNNENNIDPQQDNVNNNDNNNNNINDNENVFLTTKQQNTEEQKPLIKKRGRKPKGGKIIQQIIALNDNKNVKPNIILHLKCSMKDLYKNVTTLGQATETNDFMSYNEYSYDDSCKLNNNDSHNNSHNNSHNSHNNHNDNHVQVKDNYEEDAIDENMNILCDSNSFDDSYKSNMIDSKNIFKKLKNLQHNLHINNINDKKSACFWCTCDFDNPPIYIPKHFIKDTYEVYGCFCTPECATAYLMKENIDISEKFERYHLINNIYTKIYDYKKSIKPAPDPYYILDKYYGNLSIQEYRTLLRGERLFIVVDKPLTRILPELHEDNDDFIINNKIIPSNAYQIKKKLQKKQTKNNILHEKFGLSSQ